MNLQRIDRVSETYEEELETQRVKSFEVAEEEETGKVTLKKLKMTEQETPCPICLETTISSGVSIEFCSKPSNYKRFVHNSCLKSFIESKIFNSIPGTCPIITCPFEHSVGDSNLLNYQTWKDIVSYEALLKYNSQASSLLSILCGGCHTVKSVLVSGSDDPWKTVRSNEFVNHFAGNKKLTFQATVERYDVGQISLEEYYQRMIEQFPIILSMTDDMAFSLIKDILSFVRNPERRANLQLRFLRDRPKIKTICCFKEHCFRCKTKDFHTNMTCEQNMKFLDATIVYCPNCSIPLAKGDGCNSVICVCGKQFSWTLEKETSDRAVAFSQLYPIDTSKACALVLCRKISGSMEYARAWRSRNVVSSNTALLKLWQECYPWCPSQAATRFQPVDEGMHIAKETWTLCHPGEVSKCEESTKFSIESLFLSWTQDETRRVEEARRLVRESRFASNEDHNRLIESARIWISKNKTRYEEDRAASEVRSAYQFLALYGHTNMKPIQRNDKQNPSIWNYAISNSSLKFTKDFITVERLGSSSCYPAAFADMTGSVSTLTISLDKAPRGPNWLTFGICKCGSIAPSGSDGVGKMMNSWGISDDRSPLSDSPAFLAASNQHLSSCRKLEEGDKLSATVNFHEHWFEFSLNNGEFIYRMKIPSDSNHADYVFSVTLANDHRVSIVDDSASCPLYNESHNEMYSNLKKLYRRLLVDPSSITCILPNESESVEKWINITNGNPSMAFDDVRPHILRAIDHTQSVDDKRKSNTVGQMTWWKGYYALIWSRHRQFNEDHESLISQSNEFIEEFKESAPIIAALTLESDSASAESRKKAKAFVTVFADAMDDWYEYNSSLPEPIIFTSSNCKCVPRHKSNCPKPKK